jgi:hypothetical protein
MNYLELVSAAIGGGLVKSLFDYFTSSRSARKDELTEVVRVWQIDNDRLRKENDILRVELIEIQKDLSDLKTKVILLESSHTDAPLPMWLKDISGRMLALNNEYEKTFLTPQGLTSSDYIGKYDDDIWPMEVANVYKKHDGLALLHDTWRGKEIINVNGKEEEWIIIKYVRYAGKVKIGIAGVAIPPNLN